MSNGFLSKSVYIPGDSLFTFQLGNQLISLKTVSNPSLIKENSNIVVDYSGKVTFKVCAIGIDGKAVGSNQVVVMKISGKSYNVNTNSNGYASKTFNLLPGKYTITSSYKGYSVKNTITVKNVLIAKNKNVKKSKKIKYSVKLKSSSGKAIKGKKITFKLNGKKYTTKTDKKGVAKVTFKKLKVGKYKISVTYLKYTVKKTLKVKK